MNLDKLKDVRARSGLSQVDFSKRINISPVTYSAYETGRQAPRLDVIERICREFDVSADWLLDLDTEPVVKWRDLVKMIEVITFDNPELVQPACIEPDYIEDGPPYAECTAVLIPSRVLYDYFHFAGGVRVFMDSPDLDSPAHEFKTWRNIKLNSSPLNENIDSADWRKLTNELMTGAAQIGEGKNETRP